MGPEIGTAIGVLRFAQDDTSKTNTKSENKYKYNYPILTAKKRG
jgi:hypothetical protein